MVYVIGNYIPHVELIMKSLGILGGVHLDSYVPQPGDIPILISSSGLFHGDSRLLSLKLLDAGIPIDQKTILDAHADFALYDESSHGSVYPIPDMPMDKLTELLMKSKFPLSGIVRQMCLTYGSHMARLWEDQRIRNMAMLGLKDQRQIEQILAYFEHRKIGIPQRLVYDLSFAPTSKIEGHQTHISVDIDVIQGLRCVLEPWQNPNGRSLEREHSKAICGL